MRNSKLYLIIFSTVSLTLTGCNINAEVTPVNKSKEEPPQIATIVNQEQSILYSTYNHDKNKTELYWMDSTGQKKKYITDGAEGDLSPDGKSLLIGQDGVIFQKFLSDGVGIHLSDEQNDYFEPRWSADGKQILHYQDNDFDIYMMDAENNNQITNLTKSPDEGEWNADFSPVVNQIAYNDSDGHIYVMDGNGKNKKKLTKTTSFYQKFLDWSPDGKSVLFTNGKELYTVTIDGTNLKKRTDFKSIGGAYIYEGQWSPDEKNFVVNRSVNNNSNLTGLFTVPANGDMSKVKKISNNIAALVIDWVVTIDK